MAVIDVIEAVRFNARNSQVERVRWGKVNTDQNIWESGPAEADVIEVVDKVKSGTNVWTIIPLEGQTVPGPTVRVVAEAYGIESIELDNAENRLGRTMRHLSAF